MTPEQYRSLIGVATFAELDEASKLLGIPNRAWTLGQFNEILDERERRSEELRRVRDRAVPRSRRDAEARRRLRVDPKARRELAGLLGAKMGHLRADAIECPGCGRRAVWFWLEPGEMSTARCSHRGDSCGWWGSLWTLAEGRTW